MIVGHGVDIVSVQRIQKARSEAFLRRVCQPSERTASDCRLAGIWACKEAAVKALGTGIGPLGFLDFTLSHEENGQPVLRLSKAAQKRLLDLGGKRVLVSVSHERDYAVASVILEG